MMSRLRHVMIVLAPVVLTLGLASVVLLAVGANPLEAYANIVSGSLGSPRKAADVVAAMVPLLLCSAGMLITFAAGLWNIGVEGQAVAGALAATWLVHAHPMPAGLLLPGTLVAGVIGGTLWGALIGVIRTYGGVNEIFGGLGLNFVAASLTNYLIFGPWKPPDGATMSGTDPFPPEACMPLFPGTRLSPVSLVVAIVALAVTGLLLGRAHWGLRLKAVGLNERAAHRLGVPTRRHLLGAFVACGVLAGLAGSLQVTAVYRRLIPQISGGYGYLSQLVVLLSGLKALSVPLIAFFFAAVQIGSPRLELRMALDSSLGGILQAGMVLAFLLVRGVRQRLDAGPGPRT